MAKVQACDVLHYLTHVEEKTTFFNRWSFLTFLKNIALFNRCAFLKHLRFGVNNLRDNRHSLSTLPFSSI